MRKKDDIVCVVDGANDVKLFDICGLGIAYRAQDRSQRFSYNYIRSRKIYPK